MPSKRFDIGLSWSIRWVLTLIVLLATLPAMAIIVATGVESKKKTEQVELGKAQSLTRSLCAMHRGVANEARAMLAVLAKSPMVENRDTAACNLLFTSMLKEHPELSNILLISMDGKVIGSALPPFLGTDLSDRKYFRDAVVNKAFSVGDFILGRNTGLPIQMFALPLLNEKGQITGVIGMSFVLRTYESFLSQYPMPPSARVTFVDYKGIRMLSYPEQTLRPIGQPFNTARWAIIAQSNSDEGTLRSTRLTGEQGVYVYSRLRLSEGSHPYMTVVVSFSEGDIFQEATWLLTRNVALVALAAALALFVSHTIGKRTLLRDMDGLLSASIRLGAGDLSVRAESGRGCREMRQLSETFNEMAQSLAARQTELQEAARSLGKMRNMLNNILESMPSAVIGLDRQEVITHWNQGAEHLSGISTGSALGRPLHDVFPWLAGQVDHVEQKPRDTSPLLLERRAFPEGTETKFVDILAYPLVANGVEGAVVRVDDVTRRVELETMMIQTEKMSSMGCLAGGMAHEINNPLSGILQSTQNIQRRLSPGLEANVRAAEAVGTSLEAVVSYLQAREIPKFLDSIKESGERAAKIIKNMLGFVRKGASGHIPEQLSVLVDRTIEIAGTDYNLKKKYDFRKIEIIREYEPGMPPVPSSPSDIEQVVYNLLANAAQAMGSIPSHPEPPRLILRIYQEGFFGVLEVEDNGPGMDEAVRKRVFEPLFTTKEPGEGTGLGLAVTYYIVVNSYGGSIRVESEKGKGSRFIISLPLEPATT